MKTVTQDMTLTPGEIAALEGSTGQAATAVVVAQTAPSVQLGMLRADSPAGFVAGAAELATALADIIKTRRLFSNIQGKEFVKVEGWTTLAAMLGVTPHEASVVEEPEGVFAATVELRRIADGGVVGRASAECGSPEEVDRYGKPLWANRPRNARRSMALTRATGKACRLAFSWIMTLAGYEVTPAEEMPEEAPRPQQKENVRRVNQNEMDTIKDKLKRNGKEMNSFLAWAGRVQGKDDNAPPLNLLAEVDAKTYKLFLDMQG